MKLLVRFRAKAEQDVAGHAKFIQRGNVDAAIRFLDAVDVACALLSRMPEIGGLSPGSKPSYANLRVWPIKGFERYLIFYQIVGNEVEVVRILHGARDLKLVFGDEG
jgi:toxin ParE1/3/4